MLEEFKQNKVLQYLTIAAVLIAGIILAKEFVFGGEQLKTPEMQISFPEVKIDFEFLKQEQTQQLQGFQEVSLPEEVGREDPFKPF